jgi:hypothetical protein
MAKPKPKLKKDKKPPGKRKLPRDKAQMRLKRDGGNPDWKTTELGGGKLGIECPRQNCQGKATVNQKKWLFEQRDFLSRSCTYCNWLSMIPVELLPKKDPRR